MTADLAPASTFSRGVSVLLAGMFVAGGVGGFFSGWKYATSTSAPAVSAAAPTAAPQLSGRTGGFFGRPAVSGRVVSVSGGALVVHDTQTDTDVKVTMAPGVQVTQTITVKPASIKPNQNVVVVGRAQSDGSVRATGITVG
jgi:hypothetical protein